MNKLKAKDLRVSEPSSQEIERIRNQRRDLYFILVDIVDTFNVGSFFRLADAMGVKKVWLCGKTECPPNPRIEKASVGVWKWVDWEYVEHAEQLLSQLAVSHSEVWKLGVELDEQSVGLQEAKLDLPLALVAGNETDGLEEGVLKLCDQVVELPMYGINYSMNVLLSVGLVLGAMEERHLIG